MTHPFKDKLCVFIGIPQRCTRQEARDALTAVEGIPDERITALTDYAVAFGNASKTKAYAKAKDYGEQGLMSVLTEEEFFDILEGRAIPPEKPEHNHDVTVIPATNPDEANRELEQMKESVLNRKRMKNLAKHGIPTDKGRVKIDMKALGAVEAMAKVMKNRKQDE